MHFFPVVQFSHVFFFCLKHRIHRFWILTIFGISGYSQLAGFLYSHSTFLFLITSCLIIGLFQHLTAFWCFQVFQNSFFFFFGCHMLFMIPVNHFQVS
eukprot:10416.XXX_488026_488319_1 [CDS] Oithona nana genome sequencing.